MILQFLQCIIDKNFPLFHKDDRNRQWKSQKHYIFSMKWFIFEEFDKLGFYYLLSCYLSIEVCLCVFISSFLLSIALFKFVTFGSEIRGQQKQNVRRQTHHLSNYFLIFFRSCSNDSSSCTCSHASELEVSIYCGKIQNCAAKHYGRFDQNCMSEASKIVSNFTLIR